MTPLEPAVAEALSVLGTVTVTYNPDLAILESQLANVSVASRRVVVDNASAEVVRTSLRALAQRYAFDLIENDINVGLATAQNQGIEFARHVGCQFVLLLDQDTEPAPTGVAVLTRGLLASSADGRTDVVVGPALVDATSGVSHGFHIVRGGLFWARVHPVGDTAVECINLNSSGTLAPLHVFERVGLMEEGLFIDHVDTEWAFRAREAGVRLVGLSGVRFMHRMGERSWRLKILGWRVWPYRSPLRHYYLFRNTTLLMQRTYVPVVWKVWAVTKMGLTLTMHTLFDSARRSQLRQMIRGVRDGLLGRSGESSDG